MALPSLFIGSSVEGLDVAYALQEGLEFDTEPTVWSQGIFQPSRLVLDELLSAVEKFALAVFAFTPDDLVRLRGNEHRAVRDNVLFEFGLFVGGLGIESCFYVMPRGDDGFHLPTDLLGTGAFTYNSSRKDGNLVAALGPACNKIRRAIRSLAPEPSDEFARMKALWNGPDLVAARERLRSGIDSDPYNHSAEDRAAIQLVFSFLESVSDKVLGGALPEQIAKDAFGTAVLTFWPAASLWLAPPNHVEDWWRPLPKVAVLFSQWSGR